MKNAQFEHQSNAYSNYIKFFHPNLLWAETIYKDLYDILSKDLGLTLASLGDYFFEKFIFCLNDNLNRIRNEVTNYAQTNNFNDTQKEYIFYHKQFLEKRIKELFKEYNWEKKLDEKEKEMSIHDKILKELKVIEIIFKSQMDPTIHLGSGIGLARFCNEIFLFSDIELFKIGSYKIGYTSRLENSNNKLLLLNELADIYNICV